MHVNEHEAHDGGDLERDPLAYARASGLVNNHDAWVRGKVGAWRWLAVDKYGERIKELVSGGYTIDLGGAAAPVGYGAVVVDYQNPHNKPRSLFDVPPRADCVFTSHTLEHFVDVDAAIAGITFKLKRGGSLIVQVPRWTKTWLHPANWPGHEQIFCLAWEANAPSEVLRLDAMLGAYGYTIEVADIVDDNIIVIAER